MTIFKVLTNSSRKFIKGMFALFVINSIFLVGAFITQSCEKSDVTPNSKAKNRFLSSLDTNRSAIGSVTFNKTNPNARAEVITIYVDVPRQVSTTTSNEITQINSIGGLYDAVHDYGAVLQYEPSNTNTTYQYEVTIENVVSSLEPVIAESKQYLYSKGFTELDIQSMLAESSGEETDLVPFVLSLIQIENGHTVAQNTSGMFFSSAYAKVDYNDYIDCALVAIGADVLFSLGSSGAASWSVGAMKRAFGAVAKRALGPIGAAIAAVSFGLCIYDKYN